MAFNPQTGLVYIPTQVLSTQYTADPHFEPHPIGWNLATGAEFGDAVKGYLLAWDPVGQKEVWRANYLGPWNGGVLTTAGNLVAQGTAAGDFRIYRADSGEKLWSMYVQSGIMAAPVSYEVRGEQFIAVLSGWGGGYPLMQGKASAASGNTHNVSRVLVFKLDGHAQLPAAQLSALATTSPPPDTAAANTVAAGADLFGRYCSACHGQSAVSGGITPDLRHSSFLANDFWYQIVLNGAMQDAGMASFGKVLDQSTATAIRAYVIHEANQSGQAPAGSQTAAQ
jgi:alcohol dehydrogenase (cytochrome c)/quinohemoprotein ethanol dehydrogenase